MGKIIFWIVVFFLVLLALRLVNLANQKGRRDDERKQDDATRRREQLAAEPTVRCVDCGTYLPKSEAKPVANGYRCADPGCTRRR
jgi:hypothetical protein